MNTTGCCLVPRGYRSRHGLITTPVPRSPCHDDSHLGLGGLVLLNNNLTSVQDLKGPFGVNGLSQMISGSAILHNHEVTTRKTYTKDSPRGLHISPSFPNIHMVWLNRLGTLRLRHLNGILGRQLK
jgi:hypothetical protein